MSILYLSWSPRLASKRGLACTQAFGFIIYSANRVHAVMAHDPSGRVTSSWGCSLRWQETRWPWESPSTSDSHALSPKLCLWACCGKNYLSNERLCRDRNRTLWKTLIYNTTLGPWEQKDVRISQLNDKCHSLSKKMRVSCDMWWRLRGSQTTVRNT